jgi:hypothetical protein
MKNLMVLAFFALCTVFYGANSSTTTVDTTTSTSQTVRICKRVVRTDKLPFCQDGRCRILRGTCGACRTNTAAFKCVRR